MNYDNNPVVTGFVLAALAVVIACGILYISANVHCFNAFGLAKGCVIK